MEPNKPSSDKQPVMDVQRPSASPSDSPQVIQPNSGSLGRPATMEYTRPRPENPTADSPSFSTPSTHIPPTEPSKMPEKPKPKKSKKIFAALLIIIGLIGIVGAAVFFYIAYQNEEPVPAAVTEPEPEATAEEGAQATPEGVDQTIQEIDQTMNSLDDTTDFSPSDLSDDSLGL